MAVKADHLHDKTHRQAIHDQMTGGLEQHISDWLVKNYPAGKRRYNLKGHLTQQMIDQLQARFQEAGWLVQYVHDNLEGQALVFRKPGEK